MSGRSLQLVAASIAIAALALFRHRRMQFFLGLELGSVTQLWTGLFQGIKFCRWYACQGIFSSSLFTESS